MNRYLRALSITLFFYSLCGGLWIFCNASSSVEKKHVIMQESVSIQVFEEPLAEPKVASYITTPLISQKEQKQKAKVSPRKTLPSPLVETMEKEEDLSFVSPPKEEVPIPKEIDSQALHVKQQSYLQHLRERINEHKSYSKMAQNKNIEGSVVVEFTISTKGDLLSYAIVEGKTLFHKSAGEAITKSFPFPMEEELFIQNQTIQIEIVYALK